MYPLFFPPQQATPAPHALAAPECFRKEVDYGEACRRYGRDVFRRPCRFCGTIGPWGSCECATGGGGGGPEGRLEPADIEVISFQIQLYELGLDPEWIRAQVAFRGMESRERLRYELDGTEKFFADGVPSSRILPTGPIASAHHSKQPPPPPPPPPAPLLPTPTAIQKSPQQIYGSPRRESRLRYVETYDERDNKEEVLAMLGKMRLADTEKDIKAETAPKRANRRRRGKNRAVYP